MKRERDLQWVGWRGEALPKLLGRELEGGNSKGCQSVRVAFHLPRGIRPGDRCVGAHHRPARVTATSPSRRSAKCGFADAMARPRAATAPCGINRTPSAPRRASSIDVPCRLSSDRHPLSCGVFSATAPAAGEMAGRQQTKESPGRKTPRIPFSKACVSGKFPTWLTEVGLKGRMAVYCSAVRVGRVEM